MTTPMMEEPITILIICLTGFISWQGFNNSRTLESCMFVPARILRDRDYHRMLTSALIHGGWTHLIFNMFSFFSFGGLIEQAFGAYVLLFIYLSSILGGSLLALFLHRHHDYRALGASGGVCGVIFAAIFLVPGGGVYIMPIPVAIPSWLFAILFLLFSFYGMRNQLGNVGHDAHLGGALAGLAVTTIMYPGIVSRRPVLYAAVVLLSLALFAFMRKGGVITATSSSGGLLHSLRDFLDTLTGRKRR